MINHIILSACDFLRSLIFYEEVLGALGYQCLESNINDKVVGFGKGAAPQFWLSHGQEKAAPLEVAFCCRHKEEIILFYSVAPRLGGVQLESPKYMTLNGGSYYSAKVLDPEGNCINALCLADSLN